MNDSSASQYYEQFKGKTFVIEAEGEGIEIKGSLIAILNGIKDLKNHQIKVVFVYGKGKDFEKKLCKQFGAYIHPETNRIVVPDKASSVIQSERIRISDEISKLCRSLQIPHVNLAPSVVAAERRIGHQATGTPLAVDNRKINDVLNDGKVPIIGFGGEDDRHTFLHVPSTNIAADVSANLKAQKLMLLSQSGGLVVRNSKGNQYQLSFADVDDLLCLLQKKDQFGKDMISGDMVTKVHASITAILSGTKQVHIVSERKLLEEILTRTGVGTMIEKHQSHHVDYAYPKDLNELEALHNEGASYTTAGGTPFVKPQNRDELNAAIKNILVLKHNGIVIGKIHGTPVKNIPSNIYISGFVIAEDHQNSQQGQVLLSEALIRFRDHGNKFAYAITASASAKRLFERNAGQRSGLHTDWQQDLLATSKARYKENEKDLVELFEFNLENT